MKCARDYWTSDLKRGDKVKMSEQLKTNLRGNCTYEKHVGPFLDLDEDEEFKCIGCSIAHLKEFGDCIGIVDKLIDYNNVPPEHIDYDEDKIGPEMDVHWQPSNLRYGYLPEMLIKL